MAIKRKIIIFVLAVLASLAVPVFVTADTYWTGKDASGTMYDKFMVTAEGIAKVDDPGAVYRLTDIGSYSAHITTGSDFIGQKIETAFYWFNKSRIAYVKFFKVTPGQEISFVFSDNQYVYCAEFDSQYSMVCNGTWMGTGDVCTLTDKAEWIMVVFRQDNGDISDAGGIDTMISSDDIADSELNYVLFKPFLYTFKSMGGSIKGSAADYIAERIGVEEFTLPTPVREGYSFGGWKAESGKIYSGTLLCEYDADIFRNTTFSAVWNPILVSQVTLDKSYVITEQNSSDTIKITAQTAPLDALDKTISWSSSDSSIAAVDSFGRITPKNTGIAVITATAAGGASASCTVYVMGFEVEVPAYCSINEPYEITVKVYNNGTEGMSGRKRVLVDTDPGLWVYRVGDETTRYSVVAEASANYGSGYQPIQKQQYLIDTAVTTKLFYRLMPEETISKAGDYCGSIEFSVTVL